MTDFDTLREIFDRAGFDPETLTYNGEEYFLLINDQVRLTFNADNTLKNYHIVPFNDEMNEQARQQAK